MLIGHDLNILHALLHRIIHTYSVLTKMKKNKFLQISFISFLNMKDDIKKSWSELDNSSIKSEATGMHSNLEDTH
jgi:hypothetical protein